MEERQAARLARLHTRFLLERLTDEAARQRWSEALQETWERMQAESLRDLVDPTATAQALVRALAAEELREFWMPLARDGAGRALAAMQDDTALLGERVPEAARRAIDELIGRQDVVSERLVRKVLEQEAVENALRDVLFDALKGFNDTVNPFFAEWGLPALLSWVPVGGRALQGAIDGVRAEFDKRLDPEIRKYLLVFSREAKGRLADVLLARTNDRYLLALRRNLVDFLYAQSVRDLTRGIDEEAFDSAWIVAEAVTAEALAAERLGDAVRDALERFLAEHGGVALGPWLEGIGVRRAAPARALVDLAWPVLERAVRAGAFAALLEEASRDFYRSLDDDDPGAD
jgi:hypothetical protein